MKTVDVLACGFPSIVSYSSTHHELVDKNIERIVEKGELDVIINTKHDFLNINSEMISKTF